MSDLNVDGTLQWAWAMIRMFYTQYLAFFIPIAYAIAGTGAALWYLVGELPKEVPVILCLLVSGILLVQTVYLWETGWYNEI